MTPPVEIRLVGAAYAPLLAAIHKSCFSEDERWDARSFQDLFNVPGTVAWVAAMKGVPAGFVMARYCLDEAEILTLAVLPQQRSHGIAGSLIQTLKSHLRNLGVETIFLEVSVKNEKAVRLYERENFSVFGKRRNYYRDGSDACLMGYNLLTIIR